MNFETRETLVKLNQGTAEHKQWEEKQLNRQDTCSMYEPEQKTLAGDRAQQEIDVESDASEEPDEDSFFINREIASKNIDAAISRVENIIKLKDKKKLWMKRHYQFGEFKRVVGKGYGYAVFSTQALLLVKEELTRRYFTDVTSKIYTKHGRIIGMEDVDMNKLFLEDRFLAYVYLNDVLVTEGLAAILQLCAGLSYKKADEECRAVEGFKTEVQVMQAGILLSSEKKMELQAQSRRYGVLA